jgi:translation initiation factor 4A
MNLKENILRNIYQYGFEKPSPIQQKAIVPLSKGGDLIVQAQSGTGKTGTFTIGVLQKFDEKRVLDGDNSCQTIVLSPTRELARQTHTFMTSISSDMNIDVGLNIGGTLRERRDFNRFSNKSSESSNNTINKNHIVVGTPGRVLDMLMRHKIDGRKVKTLVLDEADEILSRGFIEQIQNIIKNLNEETDIVLVSATIPNEVLELSEKFMRNPLKILVKNDAITLEGIAQYYISVEKNAYKFETLCDLYDSLTISQCIIYCNRKKIASQLGEQLTEQNFTVSIIHSELTQEERNQVIDEFRSGKSRVLIATDIIARGIDVQQVSLVVNYDIPYHKETYIHRIGRSGRFGRKGVAINFVTFKDVERIQKIEQFYNTKIAELPNDINSIIN